MLPNSLIPHYLHSHVKYMHNFDKSKIIWIPISVLIFFYLLAPLNPEQNLQVSFKHLEKQVDSSIQYYLQSNNCG